MRADVACSGAAVDGVVVGSMPGSTGVAWRSDAAAAGTYALTDSTDRIFVHAFAPGPVRAGCDAPLDGSTEVLSADTVQLP